MKAKQAVSKLRVVPAKASANADAKPPAQASVEVRAGVLAQLRYFYKRNGYARFLKTDRVEKEGFQQYKKGDEIRLVARSTVELVLIRRLLSEADFQIGRPFAKGRQWRQPIYGRPQVARFLELMGD